ncbi:NnrU family protein [Sulfitobacter sp. SK012]|nr:NnrU family protein [Sulfitobacter sp. SK012]
MNWIGFAIVFVLFFATHSIPVRPAIKSRLVSKLGSRGFTLAYSVLSLVMLGLLIFAANRAPFVLLWDLAVWQKYVTLVGMFAVCMLLAVSIGRPNRFSFGGARNDQFDTARPGIVRWTRHPLLVALALWAGLHLLPNGNLAHVILFGVFLGFAILGQGIIDRRKKRTIGHSHWQDLINEISITPVIQSLQPFQFLCLRLLAGCLAYMALIFAHTLLLGVSPLP